MRGYEIGHRMALETRRACQERMMRDCKGYFGIKKGTLAGALEEDGSDYACQIISRTRP